MPPRQPQISGLREIGILNSALLSASIALVVMAGMLVYQANTSRRPSPCIKRERIFFSMHSHEALPQAYQNTRRKRMHPHRAHLYSHVVLEMICGSISCERLVSKMLICLCQLRLGGGGRGATALPIRRRFHRNRPTVFGHAGRVTLPLRRQRRLPAYDRFTVLSSFPFIVSFTI